MTTNTQRTPRSDVDRAEGDEGSDLLSNCGDALGDFATEISLADSPSNWLHASLNHIHTTAQKLPELSNDDGVDLANIALTYPVGLSHTINRNWILKRYFCFQRFSLYTLGHLKRCVKDPRY